MLPGTPVGNAVLVHGAVGELLPIFAISLLLSSRSPGMAIVVLLAFMVVAVITALIPHRLFAHVPGLRQIMAAEANTTGQTVLRLAMFLLATLIMCTALFDFGCGARCLCGGPDFAYPDPSSGFAYDDSPP